MTIGIDASRANVVERTGTEWYSVHIIDELIRQHPDAHFVLYTREPLRPPLTTWLGRNVENRVLAWPWFMWSQLRLAWEMLRRPTDILFIPAHTMPVIHPKATVVTCHDVGFERFPELYGKRPIGPKNFWPRLLVSGLIRLLSLGRFGNSELDYHRWSLRFALRQAAHLITISAFSRHELTVLTDVDPNRVTAIPLGFAQGETNPLPEATIRERYQLRRPFVLSLGRLERKKNVAGLVRAYQALLRHWPAAPDLVLVGPPGVGYDEIAAAIETVPLAGRVHQLPWLPAADVQALYRAAAAFAFPSHYEGFGLPLLEAFAAGVPVVASTAGALPEVAGEAALLVDPNNLAGWTAALQRVLTDTETRRRLIAAGHKRVAAFTWSEAARQTWTVLESVAKHVAPTS